MRIRAEADDYAWRQSDRFPSIGSDGELGEPNELFTGGRLTFLYVNRGPLYPGERAESCREGTHVECEARVRNARMRCVLRKNACHLATSAWCSGSDGKTDMDDKKVRFWVGFFLAGG